ncbi:MAG TPA: DUF6709 family protein [Phycisphaerae bacterium]|nr:DUF6709 family protein [Phycisphaerae bacterium]
MLSGFVAQQISRANRNLLIFNIVLLGVLGVITLAMVPYMTECVRGPYPASVADVAKLVSPSGAAHRFVTLDIDPTKVDESYIHATGGDENANDYYHFLHLDDDHYIVIENSSEDVPAHVQGEIAPLNSEITEKVFPMEPVHLWGQSAEVIVHDYNYRWGFYMFLVFAIPCAFLFLWNIARAMGRMKDPLKHPFAKQLAKIGLVEEMAIALDAEMLGGGHKVGRVQTTQSWLVRRAMLGCTAVYLGDLAWAYQKSTKHRTNGIPTGTTYSMVMHDIRGKRFEFRLSQQQVQTVLKDLAERVPWVVVGYSQELNTRWMKDRGAFLGAVAERKRQVLEAAAPTVPPVAATPSASAGAAT